MSEIGRTYHIRLPPHFQRKLERLHGGHYAALPIGTIAKLLLADQLRKDEQTLISILQQELRTPAEKSSPAPARLGPNNSRRARVSEND